jgi:hypothetical protein
LEVGGLTRAISEAARLEGISEPLVRERWQAQERFIRFMVAHGVLVADETAEGDSDV